MVGVDTFVEALKRRDDTKQVTFTTTTLSGSQTHDFTITSTDSKIDTINFKPSGASLPKRALILLVRPIATSGTTDTDFLIHEDNDREDIDEVIRITGLSNADSPQGFQPGNGMGADFDNQDDEGTWYGRLVENSGNDSQYTIRMRWVDLTVP